MKWLKKIFDQIKSEIEFILSYFNIGPMIAYQAYHDRYIKPIPVRLDKKSYIYNHYFGQDKIRMSDYIFIINGQDNKYTNWLINEVLLVNPNYDKLKRNDYVVLCNDKDEIRIAQVLHPGWPNLPDLFDGNEMVGITHWVVGKIDDRHLNKLTK